MITAPKSSSIVPVLRQLPVLTPEDSASRALDMLRSSGIDTMPVMDHYGKLLGVLALADLRGLLDDPSDSALYESALPYARRPSAVGLADMSVEEVRRRLAASDETTLMIVDADGRYLGGVSMADLLQPNPIPPRPASIGGMATPWGVYLTNGTLQAGAGNLALAASGVILGLALALSHAGIGLFAWAAQRLTGAPLYALWNADQPARLTMQTLGWFVLQGLSLPLFLLLMRSLPLAGYHAAEHQAVHAMERGESLRPEILRRMPRVHPRCGTNLLAGGLVFGLVTQGLPALHIGLGVDDSAVLGALAALFTWRSVGAFLQHYFTTKPATDKQLASGIAAAEDLERKYLRAMPRHPNLFRRIWCMGMPQTMVGLAAGSAAAFWLLEMVFEHLK